MVHFELTDSVQREVFEIKQLLIRFALGRRLQRAGGVPFAPYIGATFRVTKIRPVLT